MATNVTIKAKAWTDPRFDLLAELAGYSRNEALIRMAQLWGQCTDDETHVLSEAAIRGRLGARGVDNIIEADLGERVEGGIRIKGTGADTTDWLGNKRRAGSAGGKRRSSRAEANLKQNRSRTEAEPKQEASTAEAPPNPRDLDLDLISSSSAAGLRATVERLWASYERLCGERGLRAKPFMPGDEQALRLLLSAGWTADQVEIHLHAIAERAAAFPDERLWADGKRTWKPDVMREALARYTSGAPARGSELVVLGKPRPRDRARELDQLADALEADGR